MTMIITSCNEDVKKPTIEFTEINQTTSNTNITLIFTIIDDRSINLDYGVYVDNLNLIAAGTAINGTPVHVDLNLPYRDFVILRLEAVDLFGNLGEAYITINIGDLIAPEIININVIERVVSRSEELYIESWSALQSGRISCSCHPTKGYFIINPSFDNRWEFSDNAYCINNTLNVSFKVKNIKLTTVAYRYNNCLNFNETLILNKNEV